MSPSGSVLVHTFAVCIMEASDYVLYVLPTVSIMYHIKTLHAESTLVTGSTFRRWSSSLRPSVRISMVTERSANTYGALK